MRTYSRTAATIACLSVIAGVVPSIQATPQATAPELSPDLTAAAKKIQENSESLVTALTALDRLRLPSTELDQLRLDYMRQALLAKLTLNPPAAERNKALEEYLRQTREMAASVEQRGEVASKVSVAAMRHAVAEAEAFQAGVPVLSAMWPYPVPPLVTTKEQIAAMEEVIKQTRGVLAAITETESILPRTPKSMELKLMWQRKLFDAQLRTLRRDERRKAAEEYLAAARASEKEISARAEIDSSKAHIGLARYAVAEAEYRMAILDEDRMFELMKGPEARAAMSRMLAAATEIRAAILLLENIYPRIPEFNQLRLNSMRMELSAQLALTEASEHQALLNVSLEQLDKLEKQFLRMTHREYDWDLLQINVLRAEIEFVKASLKPLPR